LSERFIRAIRADGLAPGGMRAVELEGHEIVICNCGGTFRAIQRRCGHMNAPLELGTLDGPFVTCAMHCAQFDVTTGAALSGPVPPDLGDVNPLPIVARYLQHVGAQMSHIRVESIRTYATKLEAGWVHIAL
jgi:nitrite reductase/ring-hydroxylating ferredoxin subunit